MAFQAFDHGRLADFPRRAKESKLKTLQEFAEVAAVVSVWWLLRRARVSALPCWAASFVAVRRIGTLRAGASKTDIEGRGMIQVFHAYM